MATLNRQDLEFILQQIQYSEAHAAGADLASLLPNTFVPFGLRTVDGSLNNLLPGRSEFGAADNPFPRLVDPVFRDDADGDTFDANGPAPGGEVNNTDYGAPGDVADADPRIISNLVADQTISNPAAVQTFVDAGFGILADGSQIDPVTNLPYPTGTLLDLHNIAIPAGQTLTIPNTAADEGLSAPFNSWFTFFGQFFDHGLDLTNKGGNGTVFTPLQPDDPLYVEGSSTNFMVLTRATPDGTEHTNQTTPFVDQNQTYTSHPSHQVFLREYELNAAGDPVATGRMIDGANGGLPTWADVKAQAAAMLGIELGDLDALNLPLLRTDAYGKFVPAANGFAQVILGAGTDGIVNTEDDLVAVGTPGTPVDTFAVGALRTGHAFLNDIAHSANPVHSQTGLPLTPDADGDTGNTPAAGFYDDELLDRHFITGDGRGNENIALTAVHHVFHSEHNRQAAEIKATILATGDAAFIESWQLSPGVWDGERIFQAARFATEMQYQHLVFEEFARKMQPQVDAFLAPTGYDTTINPAILAEFAHAVFRVGHSMLTDSVDRLDPNFASNDIPLIEAFLNPLEFNENGTLSAQAAAGAIVRGMTRQQGNEIDEFVTEAVRNNLLGLPLDLPAINITRGRDTGIPTLNAARREFYEMTSDSQLKPYTSWVDLTQHLKHEASVINFIAAYGTHAELTATDVDTLAEKRAVAAALVFGGTAVINEGAADERTFTADDVDRLAFLNSTGAYALDNGVTTTGVDAIDLWIGGLAEKQMPFGGLLGSTFNFVFETQMENLQNGDRFYYLSRLAGLNFLGEMENNSFAKLVMLNTNTTHLPADIFSTPSFILEVDPANQFTGLGDGNDDPTNVDPSLTPLVIRDNPATAGADTNYLQYTGVDHVVLGGTGGNDFIISSIGDDTLWGDAGNDRLEGGDGVDNIEGGAGDDIITDLGGDDVLKGNGGNDVIHGGNGANLIIGGDGSDFIVTGEDSSEVFAGAGNDFILGAKTNLPTFGNEGHDWIELGTQDGTTGDSFDTLDTDPIIGNDVMISGGGFDELIGEGGDDIFTGSDGEDHFDGGSGFDWASYKFDQFGVTVDMIVNDLIEPPVAPSNAGILDRFAFTEGLSGSAYADVLRGDDADATEIAVAGFTGSVLTNIALINGLQALLPAGMTSFGAGNIILGGDGSDIIEGRMGDDIIDGDASLNVRIAINTTVPGQPTTVDSMKELVPYMLAGTINPSQLSIVREILMSDSTDFDTAMFSGPLANYTVITGGLDGLTFVTDNVGTNAGTDGTDTLRNIERLQFSPDPTALTPEGVTGRVVLTPGINNEPVGSLTISDDTPSVNQLLSVSALGITDLDNVSPTNATGAITPGPVSYVWQFEPDPVRGAGVFRDIVDVGGDKPATADGTSFRVTADLNGLALRVRAVYQDADGVLENVFSAATAPVAGVVAVPPTPAVPAETPVGSDGVRYIRSDLQFILDQIVISERDAAGEDLLDILPNSRVAFGLRTVDGSFNNLVRGQSDFGAADTLFPRLLDPVFRDAEANPPEFGPPTATSYAQTGGPVFDSQPRIISNLIVDQTANNPAAASLGAPVVMSPGLDGVFGTTDDREVFFIPNVTPDEGLSAPFNPFMTFFGQFFDHGLDLVTKGGNGTIFVPLQDDDPLIPGADGILGNDDDLPVDQRFLVLTRSTQFNGPGADGILGDDPLTVGIDESLDDTTHEAENTTSPFVDQNQTYTSHPSHQVFLRAYELNAAGDPVATGRLITNRDLGDGIFGNGDDVEISGMATWAVVKAQARDILGIQLDDLDALDLPLLAADAYGKFIPDPVTGFAQIVLQASGGPLDPDGNGLASGSPGAPIDASLAIRTGHAFLNDIAHSAAPVGDHDGNPSTPNAPLSPDADLVTGGTPDLGFYDNELLDAHFMAGDGRVNENIALTTVHHVFHAEHNRLVEHTKAVILASNDPAFIAQWHLPDGSWNGERLFQAARFGTEMQYQHLVFEEFARKVQPQVDIFFAATQVYDTAINPAIVAEFAHTVYRFGHSMLTETVDRFDPDFAVIGDPNSADPNQQLGLIAAFLNPLEFAASGPTPDEAAGALVRGLTRQQGNEIDEFVTEALRNNLLGLPLDLPTINLLRGRDTGVPSLNAARRDFYDVTGDSQLKPYTSWADLVQHLKHEASLINFIAAYGTHETIINATLLVDKRAAADLLVFGDRDPDGIPGSGDEILAPADRLAFLNSTGEYANGPDGVTSTGVDAIDLWIGGLAEKQMPFGGLLGSTFNFVFEEQMEKLQDGDRFYYLERTQGLNFLTELENNSFARLVMANTDATHLPGDVFSTPGFILEVDPLNQFTGLGPDGRDDPVGGTTLTPLVLRNNPATDTPDPNYLQYTGADHVVLGGTGGDDTIISSIGDDTLYGDGGHDRLDGGDGVDMIRGGAGDDIITDLGGDDNLQGGEGNDAIHGGNGLNLILGGFGSDFIVTGEDASEAFGGPGNDFILGVRANEFVFGNEGDDWIELGMADGAAGENFDAFGRDQVVGHDVFIGDSISDRMDGEGGDDIMVGNGGQVDRYEGLSGFDWAVFKDDPFGLTADLLLRAFDETPVPLSNAAVLARFTSVEGMSGSAFGDVLRGDDNTAIEIAVSGATGSVLTQAGIDRIDGLQAVLGAGVTSFGAGNIILGGDGSDILEGRGGDDIIDGDAWLNVRISVRANADGTGAEIATANSMTELQAAIFAGTYNPGQLTIAREILTAAGPDFDTAVFSDVLANYEITTDAAGQILVSHVVDGAAGQDGTDTLRNIERAQFSDQALVFGGLNSVPDGLLTISDDTPTEDQPLTVSALGVTDLDNVSATNPDGAIAGNPISFFWQAEVRPGIFEDILIENSGGEVARAIGETFTPRGFEVGLALRVRAVYKDANDVLENVYSAATAPLESNNSAPGGQLLISDTTPTETQPLQALNQITDLDGLPASFSFQWQQNGLGGVGGFTNIPGATGDTFTPTQGQVNRQLQVVVTYTDLQGHPETVTSAATVVTGNVFTSNNLSINAADPDGAGLETVGTTAGADIVTGGAGANNISGLAGNDILNGLGGADTLNGNGGADQLNGDAGADTLNGDAGADTMTGGNGADTANGGDGADTFVATIGDGNDTYTGGAGIDTYDLSGTTSGATVTATTATSAETGSDTLPLATIENIIGSQGDDSITLNGSANVIDGQDGNDTVNAGGGNDTVFGRAGADTITGGAGDDALNGNGGNDTFNYTIGDGADTVDGGAGTDDKLNIIGTAAAQTLAVVFDGTAITTVAGGTVTDVESITANLLGGVDTLNYGATTSAITVNLTTGEASGFSSIAGIENVTAGSGNDTLTGSAGADTLNGQAGADDITGLAGNDAINGGAGIDTFIATNGDGNDAYVGAGGAGDTYDLSGTTAAATVNLATGTATSTETGNDTLATIENVIGTVGNDTLTGSANNNTLDGQGGNDIINAGAGADIVTGGAGADTINGQAGADTLTGGLNNDTVNGGDGNDRFIAEVGDGNDAYVGGAGADTYDLSGTMAAATVNLTTGNATSTQTGTDTLATIENVIGSTGNDIITSNLGSNNLTGGDGDDNLSSGAGADRLIGGSGNDSMNGGAGNDIFVFAPGFGNDTIQAGFDADATGGGQDRLDISGLGITAADFAGLVNITDLGADTSITFNGLGDTILLSGVNGVGANTITQADFLLAA